MTNTFAPAGDTGTIEIMKDEDKSMKDDGQFTMADNIEEQVIEFIRSSRPENASAGSTTDLIGTGMLDSLAILELIGFIAKRFSVTIPAREIIPANLQTPLVVTALIRANMS